MEVGMELLVSTIGQYGYAAIFFLLWLGIVGLPVPDELVIATAAFLASLGLLHPVYAFVVGYLGVSSGLTVGFVLGRWFGRPILNWLSRKKKMERPLSRSIHLLNKYGKHSLLVSYLLPVVRHIVPYLVSTAGMKFRTYALFSYTVGFVWTLFFYLLGYLFGKNMEAIIHAIRLYGLYAILMLTLLVLVGVGMRISREWLIK